MQDLEEKNGLDWLNLFKIFSEYKFLLTQSWNFDAIKAGIFLTSYVIGNC